MDYEKAYKDLVAKVKNAHLFAQTDSTKNVLEDILPELRESEDERIRRTLVDYFGPEAQLDLVRGVPIQKIRDWLEKQKEQKPAEWSEEDERVYDILLNEFKQLYDGRSTSLSRKEVIDVYNFVKSLRPSWKPSEEQMKAFRGYIEDFQGRANAAVGGWNNFDVMIRLYEQLKKL